MGWYAIEINQQLLTSNKNAKDFLAFYKVKC